jgi:hypothetical protein
MEVRKLTNSGLRKAIWENQVTFPAQIPVFEKQARPDIQWRLVQLYFIHRWRFSDLGKRYRVTPQRAMQIVTLWRLRAMASGYIQEIPAANEVPPTYQAKSIPSTEAGIFDSQ